MKLSGKHVLVLGLGESGLAMTRWCLRNGAMVRVADTRTEPPTLQLLQKLIGDGAPAEFIAGEFTKSLLEGIDILALSPGLSPGMLVVFEARSRRIPVVGEIELFAQALRELGERGPGAHQAKVIAISGTNGKTTTTALTAHLCQSAGRDAEFAGNISPAALDALMSRLDAGRMPEIWVLELSSFQLETTETLNADAAVVLNVSDDHLDRYGDLDDYASVKSRIYSGGGVQVLNRNDERVRKMARDGRWLISFGLDAPGMLEDFGLRERGGAANEFWLVQGDHFLLPLAQLPLPGLHNAANVLAALALCHAIGLPLTRMVDGLKSFKGLPHRVEKVAEFGGVAYYDDSKGTNVGATVAALEGRLAGPAGKVVLIAGGEGKGQDFSPLRESVRRHARGVVLIGKDADIIATALGDSAIPLRYAKDMNTAVRAAASVAQPGDAVLLSPACASFDMFRNYVQRAEAFVSAVQALATEGSLP
jgi:UDP-N-acetylmuramoylalanine--D-glutamate ligase